MILFLLTATLSADLPTCEQRLERTMALAERATERYAACTKALEVATSSIALEPSTPPPVQGPTFNLDLGHPLVLVGTALAGGLIGFAVSEVIR